MLVSGRAKENVHEDGISAFFRTIDPIVRRR
jgi:hypothetical protein